MGPESNGNEGILHISQISSTETSPLTGLGWCPYSSTEMQLAYSTAPTDWAAFYLIGILIKKIFNVISTICDVKLDAFCKIHMSPMH